jgi:transcriptional regulator with XRE-family HTH domain
MTQRREPSSMADGWRARLRLATARSGLTQAALAQRAKIAPETLSRILNDANARPLFETIIRIAGAARIRVGWLLDEPVRGIELNDRERATIEAAGVILFDALRR